MNRVALIIAAMLLLRDVCPAAARQHEDDGGAPGVSEQADSKASQQARRRGYQAEAGGTYLDLMIPRPIDEQQLERYALVLNLSAAQQEQFHRLYTEYREKDWSYRQSNVQPLWDRSGGLAAVDARSGPYSAESVSAKLSLFEQRNAVLQALVAGESRFFEAMTPFLSDEQLALMERVRRMRRRERSRSVATAYPGANVDLIEMLYELNVDGYTVVPSDAQVFDEVMAVYENELTSRLRRAAEQRIDVFCKDLTVRRQTAELVHTIDDRVELREAVRPLHEARMALYENAVAADRSVYRLNATYLPRLAELLPMQTAAALVDAYQQTVFRPLYPDPYDATEILEQAQADADVNGDQHAFLLTIKAEYESKRASIAQQMEQKYLQWREQVELRSGYNPDEYDEYQQEMQSLQQRRQEAAHAALESLIDLLDDQQIHRISSLIDAFQQRAAEFEQRRAELARLGQVWPGPGQ